MNDAELVPTTQGENAMRHCLNTLLILVTACAGIAQEIAAPPFAPAPVIEWGKPLEGGPIRAIFLLQSAKEEGLEFLRRFDVQGDVYVSKKGGKYGVDTTSASLCRRKLTSEKIDVFVVGGIYWKRIPATLRLAVLEKVQEGMGLLYVDAPNSAMDTTLPKLMAASPAPEAVAAVTEGIPIPLLPLVTIDPERNAYTIYPDAEHPAPKPEELVSAARFGKGRICLLHYSVGQSNVVYLYSLTPGLRRQDAPFLRTYPYWEYCHSLLGKAVRWCAGRKLGAVVRAKASGWPVATDPLAEVTVTGQAPPSPVDIEVVIRDRYFTSLGRVTQRIYLVGDETYKFDVNISTAQRPFGGLYFVDAWARCNGKVMDWATVAVEIPRVVRYKQVVPEKLPSPYILLEPREVRHPRIEKVSLNQPRYASNEPVQVRMEVSNPSSDTLVDISLVGTDGRILQRQTLPAQKQVSASFSLAAAQTLVSYIDARLKKGNQTLWRERTPVFLAPGTPDEFFAYSWMQGETYYSRDYLRRIQDQGVDSILAGGGAASYFFEGGRMAAEMNLRLVPTNVVAVRYEAGKEPTKLPRPLTDEKTLNQERKRIRETVPYVAPLQPIGYSLMDEWVLGLPEARTDYSDSAVAAFRLWLKTQYRDIAALNAEWSSNFATWGDVQPAQLEQAREGLDLANVDWSKLNLSSFVDYRLFMDTVGPTAFVDFARTIRELDPGAKVGLCGTESSSTWFGHDWFHLCNALDFVVGYGDAGPVPNITNFRGLQREFQRSFLQPGSLLGCWVGYSESDFYREQALKLLLHGFHGIAYFAGDPSAYEDFPYLNYDFTLSRRALISGEGVREIRQGLDQLLWNSQWDNSGIAIYLSQSSLHVASALGQEGKWGDNCVAITRAVEDAGFQYDFVASEQVEKGVLKERGYKVLILPGVACLSDPELSAIQAFIAAGGAVIFDQLPGELDGHGKSRSQPPRFEGAKAVPFSIVADRSANAAAMRSALDRAGRAAPVQVDFDDKTFLPTETILHRNGDHLLVSLQTDVASWNQPKPTARITLPLQGFVYDVREGKPLGRMQTVSAVLDPMHILLYAVLPYEVKSIAVAPSAKMVKQGAGANLRVSVIASAPAGRHFVRVSVQAPDGQTRPGFARTVRCDAGKEETTLRFALNDPIGVWKITARDVETGVTSSATMEVTK